MRIVGPIRVVALVSQFFAASLVVTILAHSFGVEGETGVRTGSYKLFLNSFHLLTFCDWLPLASLNPTSR